MEFGDDVMKQNTKKVLFTLIDIIVVIIADLWVLWLLIYYSQTIDGAFYISSKYNIFERNYLVPAQIFGITVILTIATFILYHKLRKNKLISKKYLILVLFNTLPLWYVSFEQIRQMIYYWEWIY